MTQPVTGPKPDLLITFPDLREKLKIKYHRDSNDNMTIETKSNIVDILADAILRTEGSQEKNFSDIKQALIDFIVREKIVDFRTHTNFSTPVFENHIIDLITAMVKKLKLPPKQYLEDLFKSVWKKINGKSYIKIGFGDFGAFNDPFRGSIWVASKQELRNEFNKILSYGGENKPNILVSWGKPILNIGKYHRCHFRSLPELLTFVDLMIEEGHEVELNVATQSDDISELTKEIREFLDSRKVV